MKKTVIALAVAAAMPIAAQADVTITGSVTAKYYLAAETTTTTNERQKSGLDVDSDLDISSTEVLTNGMTATASFDVGSEGDSGKVGLEGDFGALTIGSALDADGAFQFADIGAAAADAEDAAAAPDGAEDASEANAIHYAKDFNMFSVQVQKNASTGAHGRSATASVPATGTTPIIAATNAAQQESTQLGLTTELMDGLKFGYGYAKDKNASDNADVMGLTYAWEGFDFTYGQGTKADGTDIDGIFSAKYTMDEVSVKYTRDSADDVDAVGTTDSTGKDKIDITYTGVDNGLSATMEYDMDEDGDNSSKVDLEVTYVTGALTMKVSREQNKSTDASIAYDMGNADLELARDGSKKNTTVMYKVAF
ncbi:MAG TPA: hypothetical protein DE179_03890 [Oceanospirillaceae bacterium]|nr:hypothetical protein [Oceanospirillaceae bacterium]